MTPKFTTITGKATIDQVKDKRSFLRFLWDSLWKGALDYKPQACAVIIDITVDCSTCSLVRGDTLLGYNYYFWFVWHAEPPINSTQKVQLINVDIYKFEYDIAPGSVWHLFSAPDGEGEITPRSLIKSLNKQ